MADKHGNVVEYTLTIEQTGGSGMLLPGRGFLLNNELTDFSAVYDDQDPNRIQPGKRPRSSMSPTIILRHGKPVTALGSPGGSTIITTVLQLILDRFDRRMPLPQAMADPRGSQRNTAAVSAEPAFIDRYGARLEALGHELTPSGDRFTSAAEIGAATAIGFRKRGKLVAVAEPKRRGGGSALVVRKRSSKARPPDERHRPGRRAVLRWAHDGPGHLHGRADGGAAGRARAHLRGGRGLPPVARVVAVGGHRPGDAAHVLRAGVGPRRDLRLVGQPQGRPRADGDRRGRPRPRAW